MVENPAIRAAYLENGHLIVEGDMAKIDLGQVVGGKGETGAPGKDGITPSFSIENGHLYADYDNPVTPSSNE